MNRSSLAGFDPLGDNRLKTPLKKATRIINLLVEGMGVRATARITKTHPNTIQAVLEVAGSKSAFLLDKMVREVNFPFVQVDEMFCFVGCKEKNNVTGDPERGRQSIFLGVDADSKFIINWMIGKRTSCTIEKYMQDLKCVSRGRANYLVAEGHVGRPCGRVIAGGRVRIQFRTGFGRNSSRFLFCSAPSVLTTPELGPDPRVAPTGRVSPPWRRLRALPERQAKVHEFTGKYLKSLETTGDSALYTRLPAGLPESVRLSLFVRRHHA